MNENLIGNLIAFTVVVWVVLEDEFLRSLLMKATFHTTRVDPDSVKFNFNPQGYGEQKCGHCLQIPYLASKATQLKLEGCWRMGQLVRASE